MSSKGLSRQEVIELYGKAPEEISVHKCPQCFDFGDEVFVSDVYEYCGHCVRSNELDRKATLIKIQDAPQKGIYKETAIDQRKKEVDFLIKDMGYIVWKDGRGQSVTSSQLRKLQEKHTCMTDF